MALHPSLLSSAAIPPIGADAELIDACNTFAAHEIARNNPSVTDDEMDVMCERMSTLAKPVLVGRATTTEGVAAKVRAAGIYLERFDAGLTGDLLASLFRDMLGLPDSPKQKAQGLILTPVAGAAA